MGYYPMPTTAEITVQRTSPEDVQNRQIYVTLDGAPIATLFFGKSVTRALEPGSHKLTADNTLRKKSIEFDVKPGQHAQFMVTSTPGWGYNFLVGLIGAAPIKVSLERIEDRPTA